MASQTITNDVSLCWPHLLVWDSGGHDDDLLPLLPWKHDCLMVPTITILDLPSCMYHGHVSHGLLPANDSMMEFLKAPPPFASNPFFLS